MTPEPLPAEVFDSHCHLDVLGSRDEDTQGAEAQDADVPDAEAQAAAAGRRETRVDEALAAARAVGVTRVVTVGYDLASSRWCAEAARTRADVFGAVAIHPNDAGDATDEALAEIAELASMPQVRAVGETGLDYYRDWAVPADQHRSFRAHIDIAKRTGKALVIHDRNAHDDVLAMLAAEGPPERVVFHCFSGDAEMAKVCADRGYVMSFAGNITFKNAGDLRAAAAVAPLDLILVETDAPYLTPVPHRGRPNAPVMIPLTTRRLAEVKGVDLTELCHAISANGVRTFGSWTENG